MLSLFLGLTLDMFSVSHKQVNIGTAYLNRGYFELAKQMYRKVLSLEKGRQTALKGCPLYAPLFGNRISLLLNS